MDKETRRHVDREFSQIRGKINAREKGDMKAIEEFGQRMASTFAAVVEKFDKIQKKTTQNKQDITAIEVLLALCFVVEMYIVFIK
jgi:hypothetical protein